ncbi:hypothetical protein [uncultured Mediterranean phage]|nr:hypothetical protein [uncultured Mediterranean phage]
MRLGFIVGRGNEVYRNDALKKKTPKKFLVDNRLHVDVAIAMTVKENYPGVDVDIILPKEITLQRFKKNDINFVVGYDYINAVNDDPWIPKFAGEAGNKKVLDIYKNKDAKIFPTYEYLNFIWDKKMYLKKLLRHKIPINPTIFIKSNVSVPKLLSQIASYVWKEFIIKPIGGTTSYGVGLFKLVNVIREPTLLMNYFNENNQYYKEYLVQPLVKGFKQHGEVKSFWIDGKFSYAVNIIDRESEGGEYKVQEVISKVKLDKCKEIGQKVMKVLPKISFNGRKTNPVATRLDLTCCLGNKSIKSLEYYLNEIEEGGIAGTYLDFKNVKYPTVEILADSFVKKAHELID